MHAQHDGELVHFIGVQIGESTFFSLVLCVAHPPDVPLLHAPTPALPMHAPLLHPTHWSCDANVGGTALFTTLTAVAPSEGGPEQGAHPLRSHVHSMAMPLGPPACITLQLDAGHSHTTR